MTDDIILVYKHIAIVYFLTEALIMLKYYNIARIELNIKYNTIIEERITPMIFKILFFIANAGNKKDISRKNAKPIRKKTNADLLCHQPIINFCILTIQTFVVNVIITKTINILLDAMMNQLISHNGNCLKHSISGP